MAETNLLAGEALPMPDRAAPDPDAALEESIYLTIQARQHLSAHVAAGTE